LANKTADSKKATKCTAGGKSLWESDKTVRFGSVLICVVLRLRQKKEGRNGHWGKEPIAGRGTFKEEGKVKGGLSPDVHHVEKLKGQSMPPGRGESGATKSGRIHERGERGIGEQLF